jgi:acyl carrier protein
MMDKELVLKVVLNRHFNVDPASVTPESRFEALGLDAAAEIELQMLLEKQFKITFTPYESDHMDTVQDVIDAITNKEDRS